MPPNGAVEASLEVAKGKGWSSLYQQQRTFVAIQGSLQLALMGWALWDVRHREPQNLRGNKKLWTALAFVQPVGPIAYLLFGRKRKAQ